MNLERRMLKKDEPLAVALANDMFYRSLFGRIVIITERPGTLLPPLRKLWLKEIRRQQKLRASTTDVPLVEKYSKAVGFMQRINFTTKSRFDDYFGDVIIATPEMFPDVGTCGMTIYLTCPVNKETLLTVLSFMPNDGLVVEYRREG